MVEGTLDQTVATSDIKNLLSSDNPFSSVENEATVGSPFSIKLSKQLAALGNNEKLLKDHEDILNNLNDLNSRDIDELNRYIGSSKKKYVILAPSCSIFSIS